MQPNIDLPEKITKADLSNNTKMLRELALSRRAFALPLVQKGVGQIGMVCSLDACRAYMRSENAEFSDVLMLRTLEARIKAFVDAPPSDSNEFSLITIGEKPDAPAAGLVFYRGPQSEKLVEYANTYSVINGNGHSCDTRPVACNLNIDHPATIRVLSRELRSGTMHIEEAIENNLVLTQKDGRFAGLSRKWALALRARMFPNSPQIFDDATASDINQRFGTLKDQVEGGKTFARIVVKDRWQNIKERDLVIVPGYAVEFLRLNPETGEIEGVHDTNTLSVRFNMDGEIDTDFLHKTRFRLNSPNIGKLNLVENAMKTLRTSEGMLTLQNTRRQVKENGKERRIHGTHGLLKFKCPVGVSFTLHADGLTSSAVIGSGRPNALCKAAFREPHNIEMVYRGLNYNLLP